MGELSHFKEEEGIVRPESCGNIYAKLLGSWADLPALDPKPPENLMDSLARYVETFTDLSAGEPFLV